MRRVKEFPAMRTVMSFVAAVLALVAFASSAAAQSPMGALAIDQRQGDQWGWAVDYETTAAAREVALRECGTGCSVVLTFDRCGAYAADQDNIATAFGWGESYASADGARQRALAECRSRGGSGCMVRVWGCNGPVVEEELGLDRAARRQIQQGLQAGGFDPGGADGLFGPRTRSAIRGWQASRGGRATGYLDAAAVAALRSAAGSRPAVAAAGPAGTSAQEDLFWQSIMNSTNPAEFEAYLRRFPNGVFSELAESRLAALRGSRVSGVPAAGTRIAAGGDMRPLPGAGFRSDETCAAKPAGAACWMEIVQQPGCYVWNSSLAAGASVTWTGECAGGLAQGRGTLTWASNGAQQPSTGRLQNGKYTGNWVIRFANGQVEEGPYVDGERNGNWVIRFANGLVSEGPFVDGQQNGNWVVRFANGQVEEGPYVDGERNDNWVIRFADGSVTEGSYVDGLRNGDWVHRGAAGFVSVFRYVDDEIVSSRDR